MKSTRYLVVIGGVALMGAAIVVFLIGRSLNAAVSSEAAAPSGEARIVLMGLNARTSEHFYLDGGSYYGIWSAWGETPEEPPCTHSVELMAVDPANGSGSNGHVIDLARSVQVPSTGASAEVDLLDLKSGDYYLQITSACAWQIELSPYPF